MSNIEHLIENAIYAVKRDRSFEDFKNQPHTKSMMQYTGLSLEDIWEIAGYVVYSYKPYCINCGETVWYRKEVD